VKPGDLFFALAGSKTDGSIRASSPKSSRSLMIFQSAGRARAVLPILACPWKFQTRLCGPGTGGIRVTPTGFFSMPQE
jgi:hypothetical protein